MSERLLSILHISSPSHRRGATCGRRRALSDAPVVAFAELEGSTSIGAPSRGSIHPFGQVSAQCPAEAEARLFRTVLGLTEVPRRSRCLGSRGSQIHPSHNLSQEWVGYDAH